MAFRDILNFENEVIGQLELPDDTTEEAWSDALAVYALPPAVPLAPILRDVTPRQIRQALILSGVQLSQIDDAINQLPEPTQTLARVEWEYSTAFQRNRPLVAQIATMLSWTSDQLDSLWILASKL